MLTTISIIALAAALLVVWMTGRESRIRQPMLVVLSLAIIAFAGIAIVTSERRDSGYEYDPVEERAVGKISGQRIAELARFDEAVVIAEAEADTAEAAIAEALKKAAEANGLRVVDVISPFAAFEDGSDDKGGVIRLMETGVDESSLRYAMEKFPEVNIFISLAGVPVGLEGFPAFQSGDKQLFVFDVYATEEWKPYLGQGYVDGVIVPLLDEKLAEPSDLGVMPAGEVFAKRYRFITP